MSKSALTAAMSTGGGAPPVAQSDSKDDVASFPCLKDPAAELAAVDQEAMKEAMAETKGYVPVGSMPTYSAVGGAEALHDYEVNPRNRRGGQEISSSLKSGMSLTPPGSMSQSLQMELLSSSLGPSASASESIRQIQSSLGQSPTAALLNEIASGKIGGRTTEAKKLRRHVLRGAIVVIVTAGYSGKRFIYEKIKDLGCRAVILDAEDSWSSKLVEEGVIEKFIAIDFSDTDVLFDKCMDAIKEVKDTMGDVDGLVTFCELAVPLMTRLSEVCGLPGNTSEAVDNARNKHQTRKIMSEAGLPTPANFLIKEPSQLEEAAKIVGFPAVLKPIHGAASLGVIRCDNFDALTKAYSKVANELKSARVVAGAIMQGEDADVSGNAGTWICLDMIFEEYLDGPEVDCDLVFSEGKCVYGCISDNWPTIEPYFNETGSNCPSILPLDQQRDLLSLSVKAVAALGFQCGVFHVEGKFTSRGARLIEVNCRMGGGPVRDINLLVYGVDLVEEQLMCSVGIPARPPTAPKPLRCIAEYSLNAKKSGILKHTNYLGEWKEHPDVMYIRPIVKAGGKCVCVDDGMPTWVCEMMVERPNVHEAIALVQQMEAAIQEVLPIE